MKLQVRVFDGGDGSFKLVVCDETGKMLPEQTATRLDCEVMGLASFTVKFVVAGDVELALDKEAIP